MNDANFFSETQTIDLEAGWNTVPLKKPTGDGTVDEVYVTSTGGVVLPVLAVGRWVEFTDDVLPQQCAYYYVSADVASGVTGFADVTAAETGTIGDGDTDRPAIGIKADAPTQVIVTIKGRAF